MSMWMDVDVALPEIPVNLIPLVDAATGKVVDEGVTYDAAGMNLIWHFTTTAGATTATAVTPTTGGDYDWAHQNGGMYTIEMPASGGASANNDTAGFGHFTGNTTANLPFRGPTIGFRAAAINDALIDGGDVLDVSVTELGGVAQRATDLAEIAQYLIANSAEPITSYVADDSLLAKMLAADGDISEYNDQNHSLEALRVRGDADWTTATNVTVSDKTGFSLASAGMDSVTLPADIITAVSIAASALDSKGNWNTTTPPTAAAIKTAIEAAGSHLALILEDTGTTLPGTLTTLSGYVDCLPATLDGSTFTNLPDVTTDAASRTASKADVSGLALEATLTAMKGAGWSDETLVAIKAAIDAVETGSGATSSEVNAACDQALADWGKTGFSLSGTAAGSGPTAMVTNTDGVYACPAGGTLGLYKRIRNWDGDDITQADITSIKYTIYALSGEDEETWTAVTGHTAETVTKAAVIYDAIQTDSAASNYNFKHVPAIGTYAAFETVSTVYLVEYTITPTDGQKIVERFRVSAV